MPKKEPMEQRLAIKEFQEIAEGTIAGRVKNAIFSDFQRVNELKELLGLSEGFTPQMVGFLTSYAVCGTLGKAAPVSNVSIRSHYNWLKDAEYAAAFEESKKVFEDLLENLAFELVTGVHMRPVVSAGKLVCYEPIIDTRLLATVLRARLPQKYGQKVDITSNGHSLVKLVDKDSWDSV